MKDVKSKSAGLTIRNALDVIEKPGNNKRIEQEKKIDVLISLILAKFKSYSLLPILATIILILNLIILILLILTKLLTLRKK